MIIAMSRLVDTVPSDEEVDVYARMAYLTFTAYRERASNVQGPRWDYLRRDLKSFWLGQARMTLSAYAYNSNPVEADDG